MTSASQAFADLNLENEAQMDIDENPNSEKVLEDLVLCSIHTWMQKGTREVIHSSVKKGFPVEEIRAASQKLSEVGLQFKDRRGGGVRSKVDLFIDDILTHLYTLDDSNHLPKIIVNSKDLTRMPLVAMAQGDTVEISTRLHSMEKEFSELKMIVTKMAACGGVPTPPRTQVTGMEETIVGAVIGGGQGHPANSPNDRPWSQVAGGKGHQGKSSSRQGQNGLKSSQGRNQDGGGGPSLPLYNSFHALGGTRSRSDSVSSNVSITAAQKRSGAPLEEPKSKKSGAPVAPKNKKPSRPPAKCGTGGTIGSDTRAKVADFEMYVGRTHPDTSEDDIIGLVAELTSCENVDGVVLSTVDVINEVKDKQNRIISKSWRVTFPFSENDRMLQDSAWPAGWTYRQYFPAKKQKKQISLIKPGVIVNGINSH